MTQSNIPQNTALPAGLRLIVDELKDFSPLSYLIGEYIKTKDLCCMRSIIENRKLLCIAPGPSLDCIDLKGISCSTVLLLNGAASIYPELANSNRCIWYANDSAVIKRLIGGVPFGLRKVMTVHKYRQLPLIARHMNPGDIFFQPRPTIRKRKDGAGLPNIRPAYRVDGKFDPTVYRQKRIHLYPDTVVVNAVALALSFYPRSIEVMGFDLPVGGEPKTYSKVSSLSPDKGWPGFNRYRILKHLQSMRQWALGVGIPVKNNSPLGTVGENFQDTCRNLQG